MASPTGHKVVVGSRAEAKAVRKAAQTADRERARSATTNRTARTPDKPESRALGVGSAQVTVWTSVDAAAVLATLLLSFVAKEAVLRSELVQAMPDEGQIGARAIVLGTFYAAQLGVLVYLARRRGVGLRTAFGLVRVGSGWSDRVFGVLVVLGALVLMRGTATAWSAIAQTVGWAPPDRGDIVSLFGTGGIGVALSVAMVVLVGPAVEELVFRGVILGWARERWGPWLAALSSAALFSLYHFTPWILVPTFVLGVVLAWLVSYRGSLWPAIALHAAYNATVVAAALYLAR